VLGGESKMRVRVALAALAVGMVASVAHAEVDRPPQFVVMAFDGGIALPTWQNFTDFSEAMNRDGKPVHFTVFVSGIGYIENADRRVYQGPGMARGSSAIGFGGSADDVRKRIDFINAFYANGHEIASHAMGHFNGGHWSAAQWEQEFAAYHTVVDNAGPDFARAGGKIEVPFAKIVGFRAPYLATGPGLYEALRRGGYRYDTSGIARADQWPRKADGLWRFDLAQVKVAGRLTLSMDYNFFIAQSGGAVVDQHRAEAFRAQTLAAYLDYFRSNYTGNRAPLNIGHHFEPIQGGVYNEALKDFARQVCGLPEVKCVTYSELADFMDAASPETLAAYQRGEFVHAAPPATTAALAR
jgi:peptidoglycan/xylan/chitin deacetylase (PgdA/CDA1 family)